MVFVLLNVVFWQVLSAARTVTHAKRLRQAGRMDSCLAQPEQVPQRPSQIREEGEDNVHSGCQQRPEA